MFALNRGGVGGHLFLCKSNTGLQRFNPSLGLTITTDSVANATNIFFLVTTNSGLVATLVTRFLYDLDLN